MSEGALIGLIALGFPVAFGAFWLLITGLLAKFSGWTRLAREFPDREEIAIESMSMRSARLGGVNYNNCLRIDICPTGLRVAVFRLLGPFSKPFFVPWGLIRPERQKIFWMRYVRLELGMQQDAALAVHEKTFERIAARSPLRLD